VGETSPMMRGNQEGVPRILNEGFGGRLDGGDGLAVVDISHGDLELNDNSLGAWRNKMEGAMRYGEVLRCFGCLL
jgi:hypothetical protein